MQELITRWQRLDRLMKGVLVGTLIGAVLLMSVWSSLRWVWRAALLLVVLAGAYWVLSRLLKSLYLTARFFGLMGILIAVLASGFIWSPLLIVGQLGLLLLVSLVLVDGLLLHHSAVAPHVSRTVARRLSLGDENGVTLEVDSHAPMALRCVLIDELPVQFQKRDFELRFELGPGEEKTLRYPLRPVERGLYIFHDVHLFIQNRLQLLERRLTYPLTDSVAVYPSVLEMKRYELLGLQDLSRFQGIKKMRRIGHSYEFEQIKNYVRGDDYRSINWKATSRRGQLMVNQYEDERAQQVYNVIDKSRAMRLPFHGMSLMDYAINTSLVVSNVVLRKDDRAGLFTFSDKIGTVLKADRTTSQLNQIMEALYNEAERDLESNYELLYISLRRFITGRSLLFLYTNFESKNALERVLPILRKINRLHVLVVVFFENAELQSYADAHAATIQDIYFKTTARQYLTEKAQMVQSLRQYGIQSVLTTPEALSIDTLNKYLELKSRGLI